MKNETQNQQVNKIPATLPQSAAPTSKIKLPIILCGLFLILLVGGVYYLRTQQNKISTSNTFSTPTPTEKTVSQVTPVPTAVSNAVKQYKTRYFSVTDSLWDNNKYPIELTQLAESSLTPIYCTPTYSIYGKGYASYDEKTRKPIPLTDTSLLSYIQTINKKHEGKTVSEIFTCAPEKGKTIVLYALWPCGNACSGTPYVGVVNGSDIQGAVTIQENMPYFGCRKPLQLSNDNMFYFGCGGGDGTDGSISIYRLSLNNLALSKVNHCEAGIDKARKQYSKCE